MRLPAYIHVYKYIHLHIYIYVITSPEGARRAGEDGRGHGRRDVRTGPLRAPRAALAAGRAGGDPRPQPAHDAGARRARDEVLLPTIIMITIIMIIIMITIIIIMIIMMIINIIITMMIFMLMIVLLMIAIV